MYYSETEARELVLKACHELVEHKLIARTWGNISARISEDEFVITPSGRSYDGMDVSELVKVKLDGSYSGEIKPSSEKGAHAVCYKLRSDVNFVIHTHQTHASVLSILGRNIPFTDTVTDSEKKILGSSVVCAGYGMNATKKLNNNIYKALSDNPDANHTLMRYHGALCFGADYDKAFEVAYTLENVSEKIEEYILGEKIASKPDIIEKKDDFMLSVKTPYICKMSSIGCDLRSFIDDMGQIAGVKVRCMKEEAASEYINQSKETSGAVMIKDKGAICFGTDWDEAYATALVLEKACEAAYLGRKTSTAPINCFVARKEHRLYVTGYSKLKNKQS